jgi:hypothetical protein
LVSSYAADAKFEERPGVTVTFREGGKYDSIYALFLETDLIGQYDYIWLPDDDIDTTPADIDALFVAMRRYDLALAQPSLTRDSHYTYFLLNKCRGFTLRYTNFVEIMMPCFRSSHLQDVCSEFEGNMSGFGLDHTWCRIGEGLNGAAIIDDIAVRHTRPIGQHLRKRVENAGISPEEEEAKVMERYGIPERTVPMVYAAIDRRGKKLEGVRRLGVRMGISYATSLLSFSDRRRARQEIKQIVRAHVNTPLDMSPLSPPTCEARIPGTQSRDLDCPIPMAHKHLRNEGAHS